MPSHQPTNRPPETTARKKNEEPPLDNPEKGLDRLAGISRARSCPYRKKRSRPRRNQSSDDMRPFLVVAFVVLLAADASAQSSNQPPRNQRVQEQPSTTAPGPQPPINITVNVPEPNPQIAKDEASDRADNLKIQGLIGGATVLIAIITGLQMFFGILGYRVTKKAADAAEKSADVASKSLQLIDRPWVSVSVELNGPLTVHQNGDIELLIRCGVKNVGKSVAQHIDMHILPMPAYFKTTDRNEIRNIVWDKFAEFLRSEQPEMGFALFPSDHFTRNAKLVIPAAEMVKAWGEYPRNAWCARWPNGLCRS